MSPGMAAHERIQGTGPGACMIPAVSLCPDAAPGQDFSEGVRCMKQIKKTPQGIEANLNVSSESQLRALRAEERMRPPPRW